MTEIIFGLTHDVYKIYYLIVTLHTIITQLYQEAGNLDCKSYSSLHGLGLPPKRGKKVKYYDKGPLKGCQRKYHKILNNWR